MAKKQNTQDILLYGAIGVASGLLINEIQNFLLWFSFRNESYKLYKAGLEKFGKPFEFWWEVQKNYIDLQNGKINEAEAEVLNTEAQTLYNPTLEQVVDAERWYIENCKWLNKPGFFRQRYAYTNYALIIGGIIPLLTQIRSKTLQYILFGGGVVGLFNAIRFNIKSFNIYKLQTLDTKLAQKLYWDLAKVINKDFYEASFNGNFAGYIVWSIYKIEEDNKAEQETTE
jgi:hypothetical protein